MASLSPDSCCYKGVKHEGAAKGKLSQISGIEAYTVYPESQSTDKAILILTDILGHQFINIQLIADQFAANGYCEYPKASEAQTLLTIIVVVIPDIFEGDPVPLSKPGEFDMEKWRAGDYNPKGTAHSPPNVDPIVDSCLTAMRDKFGCKTIGAVGYCFGAKYVVRFLQPSTKVDVGFMAHPSGVTEEELGAIKGPLAIAAAETDAKFPPEKRHKSELILQQTGLPYQINLYSGVNHGFAVRGDLSKRVVKYAKETAFLQAVQWFNEHL